MSFLASVKRCRGSLVVVICMISTSRWRVLDISRHLNRSPLISCVGMVSWLWDGRAIAPHLRPMARGEQVHRHPTLRGGSRDRRRGGLGADGSLHGAAANRRSVVAPVVSTARGAPEVAEHKGVSLRIRCSVWSTWDLNTWALLNSSHLLLAMGQYWVPMTSNDQKG